MSKRKIINDPIYGLVNFPFDLIYDIIDHKYFQRLRRISQMGLSNYVYPGATHSRFAHALGALHLLCESINTLRNKGIEITDDEYLATSLAILLHDIGHGPFSHALEHVIIQRDHEDISLDIMQLLNNEYGNKLELAIKIFKGQYKKKFLTQLVSSQLDMDRMDYLTRDSYYSGVAEGVIGYKRIIAMLNVSDNELVVEEKGVYSIEKFIVARHIMYWQVYLHKASVCIEQMLRRFVSRLKYLLRNGAIEADNTVLHQLLLEDEQSYPNYLEKFTLLDDMDVFRELKISSTYKDPVLRILGQSILDRKLFGIRLQDQEAHLDELEKIRLSIKDKYHLNEEESNALLIFGKESNKAYNIKSEEIKILTKETEVVPVSEMLDINVSSKLYTKYFICFPK